MSAEDQILDTLWRIKATTFKIADAIDRKADDLANQIRDTLSRSTWLPESARPAPPPPPKPAFLDTRSGPSNVFGTMWRHRYIAGAVLFGVIGGGGYYFISRKRHLHKKRRAKRAPNNARKEVVVLAGSPHDAVTKSLALDLEHRGFIVFIVVNSMDDEQLVLSLGGRDIRPLNIDLLDTEGAQATVDRFQTQLKLPVRAFNGAQAHQLSLAGFILVPDSSYPSGPVETLSAENWSDTLNLRLLSPFITSKLFIPLLRDYHSRMLILTPSVVASINAPFHAAEAAAVAALDSFTTTLRRELASLDVSVTQMKLGTFDLSSINGRAQIAALNGTKADIFSWAPSVRGAYGRSYATQIASGPGYGVKGSPLRELHLAVFDALTDKRPRKFVRVGSGSLVYDLVGRLAPDTLVNWMVGKGTTPPPSSDELVVSSSSSGRNSRNEGSVEWEKVERMA